MRPNNQVPGTFRFMLRWQLIPLVLGIVLIAASCAVLVMKGDPPGAQIQSIAGMVGKPAGWIGLVLGVAAVFRAWYAAHKLRNG